jgi:uncharacterized membrane protein
MREAMLIVHFIGLAMGLGTSFGFLFLGIASKKMEASEGKKFMMNSFTLSTMGHVGLTLLILSGGYLMTPYWKTLTLMPMLMVKLVLVVVLAALIGIISSNVKKIKRGDAGATMEKVAPLGRLTMLISLAIVILAVLIFR